MNEVVESKRPLVAPLWHTAVLIAIFLGLAAYGAMLQHSAQHAPGVMERKGSAVQLYAVLLISQWALLRFAIVGLRKGGTRLRDLIAARWSKPRDVLRDIAIALLVWAAWTGLETLATSGLGADTAKSVDALLPRDPIEIALWVLLSMSAGFCEETIFRGYLQRQFQAITGSAWAGLAIQALIFGVAHGYQGLRNTIAITLFGAVFGAVALWRKSLAPGMILHAWTDIFSGIFAPRV